jgi:cytochrome c556
MKKTSIFAVMFMLLACIWAGSASAQFTKPKQAEEYRQAVMTLISSHFGRMGPVMKGQKPYDKAEIQANVAILSTLAALPWQAFPEGTQSEYALADIWKDPAGFKAAQEKFTSAVAKLSAAADTGDLEQIKKSFGAVGASCKSCHDVYHEKK